jgi:hypothetical protein
VRLAAMLEAVRTVRAALAKFYDFAVPSSAS